MIRLRLTALGVATAFVAFGCTTLRHHGRSAPAVDPTELATLLDEFMTRELAKERIPGAGFVFVQDGRVLLQRGYGRANIATEQPSDPETTVWRIGSISKVVTATAVMQLADRGRIDLDAAVDRYVQRVPVPPTYPEPVTIRHLLTHTGGFDEIRPGTQASSPEAVLPLDRFLQDRLVRIHPPGRITAYSTYGITLAGALIEDVAGVPFETFLRKNIWEPAGMRRTSITIPAAWERDVAIGYEISGESFVPQAWEWYHTTPASSVNSTVADMGRFLTMHLALGKASNGSRILSQSAARAMQRQQVTMHPSMPGYALGFNEDYVGNLRVIEHAGNMAGFSALMVLIPDARAGFFVVHHREGSKLRDNLKWALLERFFPRARERKPVPAPLPAGQVQTERFVGRYAPLWSCWSCRPVRVPSVMNVTANPDGTLEFASGRYIAVDSSRFINEKSGGSILFDTDASGTIRLFAGGFWGWQKLP